jgi:cytochrome-b5 reductase
MLDVLLPGNDGNLMTIAIAILVSLVSGYVFFFKKETTALDPDVDFRPFQLIKKEELSHDTRKFTFALQNPTMKLGLPIGQHISFRFKDKDGKNHQRSYTPVTGDEIRGSVSFVIKVYKAGVHPKFPEGGKMSQHLDSLQIGDTLDMKGPKGHLEYLGKGKFTVKAMRKPLQERSARHFGMIAGGTGITPMLQVIHAIFREGDNNKNTTVSLLYANQTEDDILVREELEQLAKDYPDRFSLHYTLDRPPSEGWNGSTGFVSKEMIQNHVLPTSTNNDYSTTQVLMCGPPPMLKFACIPALTELGITEDHRFSF